jgi:4-hydroxybenzoate polyprenyltransferase
MTVSFLTNLLHLNVNQNIINYKNNKNINTNNNNKSLIFLENKKNEMIKSIPKKMNSFLKLIRSSYILPTVLLSVSGGWIIKPSYKSLIKSTSFIVSIITTVLVMSSSMVINDIYDVELDKINNPNRPIVNGEIKVSEAIIIYILLIGISEYLAFFYLPNNLKLIIQLAIIKVTIYTPILKKILLVKNISCASLVAFSLYFSGLAVSNNNILYDQKKYRLLSIAISYIFYGSLTNEIILDMRDIEGDKQNNITTIPTRFGNDISYIITNIIMNYNIISNTIALSYLYNHKLGLTTFFIIAPIMLKLYDIKKDNYSYVSIKKYMSFSNYPLFFTLIHLSYVSSLYK